MRPCPETVPCKRFTTEPMFPSPNVGLGVTGPHNTVLSWLILLSLLPVCPLGGVLFLLPNRCGDPWKSRPRSSFLLTLPSLWENHLPYGFSYHTMLTTLEPQPQLRPICPMACGTFAPNTPRACNLQLSLPSCEASQVSSALQARWTLS